MARQAGIVQDNLVAWSTTKLGTVGGYREASTLVRTFRNNQVRHIIHDAGMLAVEGSVVQKKGCFVMGGVDGAVRCQGALHEDDCSDCELTE